MCIVSQNMKNISVIFGKEFDSKLTGASYGVFRECGATLPAGFSVSKFGAPLAEDGCGNLVTEVQNGSVCFWDHETDDLAVIARSWDDFASGCTTPKKVELKPEQVRSVWVNPEFAKKMGIAAPKDGWLKKKG